MSMRPQRFTASSAIAFRVSVFVASAAKAKESFLGLRRERVSRAPERSRSTAMTLAPSCANRMQVARPLPMPLPGLCPAPITIARLFSSRIGREYRASPFKGTTHANLGTGARRDVLGAGLQGADRGALPRLRAPGHGDRGARREGRVERGGEEDRRPRSELRVPAPHARRADPQEHPA